MLPDHNTILPTRYTYTVRLVLGPEYLALMQILSMDINGVVNVKHIGTGINTTLKATHTHTRKHIPNGYILSKAVYNI